MNIKKTGLTIGLIAVCFIGLFLCSACQRETIDLVEEIRNKERLSSDDILLLAMNRDVMLWQKSDDTFAEKWPFAMSYVTDGGDILLLSDYDGDVFFREKQAWALGWREDDDFKTHTPTIIADAIAAFGQGGNAKDYLYREYAAKNILAYYITRRPPVNGTMPPTLSDEDRQPLLIAANLDSLQDMNGIFLEDINNLNRSWMEKALTHGQITTDFEGYQTPVAYDKVFQYDNRLAYMITLTFAEDFFAAHQGETLTLAITEPYANHKLEMSIPLADQSVGFGRTPETQIGGSEKEAVVFEISVRLTDGNTPVYEETVVLAAPSNE